MSEAKKRILLIEDDTGMAHTIARVLNLEQKYIMDIAHDGFEGGQKIVKNKPDLIILDIRMPRVDGLNLAGALHNDPPSKDIPIIIVSGEITESDKRELEEIGITDLVEKPFDNNALRKKVEEILNR